MRHIPYQVDGDEVSIRIIEDGSDVDEALDFIARADTFDLCLDTETTGLEIFSPGFRIRVLQIGDPDTAYVYRLTSSADPVARRLTYASLERGVTLHNAPYDLLALDRMNIAPLEDTQTRVHDTMILAHLLDPRGRDVGGVGFRLKDLCAVHIDPTAVDTQSDLEKLFVSSGWTKETGWANISADNETYLLYAGLDVIYGSRLHRLLRARVNKGGYGRLARFEHEVQRVITRMRRRGFRIDVGFGTDLLDILEDRRVSELSNVQALGVHNPNSPQQLVQGLRDMGWEPRRFTKSGSPKVDKEVLDGLIAAGGPPADLARSVKATKRAAKWRKAYVEAMLDARDESDRVHAGINSLQARTSRMSISNPPIQQLPSRGDDAWIIRRMVAASEGRVIVTADYDQIEFRVLAGLADIKNMKDAIFAGKDLHDHTAELVHGPSFTKAQRTLLKGAGFGRVFGGGAETLARQTGITEEQAQGVIDDFDSTYVELPAYGRNLKRTARQNGGFIHNAHGRFLPVEKGKEYTLVNHSVQSIAADILKQALLDLSDAGLDELLLLPVHDEVVAEADIADADEVAHLIGEVMTTTFRGLPITASGEIYGPTWAHGYVYTDEDGVVRSKGSGNVIEDWVEYSC